MFDASKIGQSFPPFTYEDVHVGDALPALMKPPITHLQLVRYAGALGDLTPRSCLSASTAQALRDSQVPVGTGHPVEGAQKPVS